MDYPRLKVVDGDEGTEILSSALASVTSNDDRAIAINGYYTVVATRSSGDFDGKALYLSDTYNWTLGTDSEGCIVLVPTKKE